MLLPAATLLAAALGASFTTPHRPADAPPRTHEIDGRTYVDHGLVAAGRLPADTVDFLGDTLGSFSSFAVASGSWRRRDDGSYEGVLWTLPDRGNNDPEAGVFFDDPARLERMRLHIAPGSVPMNFAYTLTAALLAGKHVLCEKPLTLNAAQAQSLFALARERGLLLAEAMWTRTLPFAQALRKTLADGRLGADVAAGRRGVLVTTGALPAGGSTRSTWPTSIRLGFGTQAVFQLMMSSGLRPWVRAMP